MKQAIPLIAVIIMWMLFWFGIGYVAYHFISKLW
jgi:hypothetical protein